MDMDEVLKVFIAESQELLQQMEEALLMLEHAPGDSDTINAIFRAAHTIKGSAGLFGLDLIVAFTHIAESVLDRVRSSELRFDADLTALFLQVGDHLGQLVRLVDEGADLTTLPDELQPLHEQLSESLSHYLPTPSNSQSQLRAPERIERGHEHGLSADHWHLSLRFGDQLSKVFVGRIARFKLVQLQHGERRDHSAALPVSVRLNPIKALDQEHVFAGCFEDRDRPSIEAALGRQPHGHKFRLHDAIDVLAR